MIRLSQQWYVQLFLNFILNYSYMFNLHWPKCLSQHFFFLFIFVRQIILALVPLVSFFIVTSKWLCNCSVKIAKMCTIIYNKVTLVDKVLIRLLNKLDKCLGKQNNLTSDVLSLQIISIITNKYRTTKNIS